MKDFINVLQEWSIPLIAGVFIALLVANEAPDLYEVLVYQPIHQWGSPQDLAGADHTQELVAPQAELPMTPEPLTLEPAEPAHDPAEDALHDAGEEHDGHGEEHDQAHGGGHGWEHYLTLHFLINDIFMVFFFGIAAKEIVESCLPGGSLNPPSKAINPLLGTIGGVVGPVAVFLGLNAVMGTNEWRNGWGIPTATDIALAWLVARMVFGPGHPAIAFLLLLAVADDAIGLGIIAFGYPDPNNPTEWANTWWIIPGMGVALLFRLLKVQAWWPYIFVGGLFVWWGLYSAHLHPALALVPIVPFLPHGPRATGGMFEEEADYDSPGHRHSPLENFEHNLKLPVDFGLFFFAFANAGVAFSALNNLTWIVFLALLLGKFVGIFGFSALGSAIGFSMPAGMRLKHLFVASVIAGIGLTVALFVTGQAFPNGSEPQNAAKMGALLSGGIAILAIVLGRVLKVNDYNPSGSDESVGPLPEPKDEPVI